jgi:hypothetical protein
MPRKPPPEHTRFKPGQSGNISGRPKLPDDIVQARKVCQLELERIINRLIYLSASELKAVMASPETPMFEIMIASIIAQAAQKGDQMRLEFVLQRMIGKVKDQVELSTPKPFMISRRDGTTLELGAKVEKEEDEG